MAKLTLTDPANFNSTTLAQMAANHSLIEAAIENTLSRDGTSPNQMGADLDMNNNDVLNAGTVNAAIVMIGGERVYPTSLVTVPILNENNFTSNSANHAPSQQSTKAYITNQIDTKVGLYFAADRTALKALDTTVHSTAILRESGREGIFFWDATVLVATHTADTDEILYVAPNPAANGAWVRRSGPINISNSALVGTKPYLAISGLDIASLPQNHIFLQHDTSVRGDATTVQIQRLINSDVGQANPKAVRVYTRKNNSNAQTDWSLSAELDNYSNITSTGEAAISGVSNKYGTASTFAGHLQVKDWNLYAASTGVTPILGLETNNPVVGLDHPTANNSTGMRRAIDVISRTNENVTNWNTGPGNFGDGETGVGVMIRTDNLTKGYFRFGMVIDDVSQVANTNVIGTGLLIRTSGADGLVVRGANTSAAVRIGPTTPGPYGLIIEGAFSTAAIRVPDGGWIAMSTDATRKIRWNSGADSFEFYNGADERFAFRVNASPIMEINGTQVLKVQQAALPADATDLATAITLVNAIKAGLSLLAGGHGLFA